MEIISACIESGCYSAVFAVLLVYALKNSAKREKYYRTVINGLLVGLQALDTVNVKLEEVEKLCAGAKKAREKTKCECSKLRTSAAESC